MYPFFRGGHYYYFDVLGYYVTTDLFTSHSEQMIVFILSNASILIPFCATVTLCVAVIWKLRCYRKKCDEGRLVDKSRYRVPPVTKGMETMDTSIDKSIRRFIGKRKSKSLVIKKCDGEMETEGMATMELHDLKKDGDSEVTVSVTQCPTRIRKFGSEAGKKNMIITFIIAVYIACLLPGILLNIYEMLNTLNSLPGSVQMGNFTVKMMSAYLYMNLIFSTLLFTLNSTFNPFIYHFRCNPILPKRLSRILYVLKMKLILRY